jgi:hypothetical protein
MNRPNRRYFVSAIFLAGAGMTVLAADAPRLRPGQYERTIAATIPGRPAAPPRKTTQCITADDVKNFSKAMNTRSDQQGCAINDYKQSATDVSYTQTCAVPDGSRLTSTVIITFPTEETFRAVVETSSTGGTLSDKYPMLQHSTITMTAKRIGDCSK